VAGFGFDGGSVGRLDDNGMCAAVEGRVFVVPWAVELVGGWFGDG
jgi:hypothetical protein